MAGLMLALLLPALPLLPAQPVGAVTRTVTATTDDGTTGTLRQVIASALPNDTIVFQSTLTGTIVLDAVRGPLALTQNVTIIGPGAARIIISGNNAVGVFTVNGGVTAAISGVTITKGQTSSAGGGISNSGTLTVTNSTISGNTTGSNGGGGIFSTGTLTVTGSTISGNTTSGSGGGIYNTFGNVTVTSSTISGNTAGGGGGISSGGFVTVTGSTISGNSAYGSNGGGIANGGTLTVTGSTISGNTTGSGGGSGNNGGNGGNGGGVASDNATLTVTNSTISGNTTGNGSSGIFGTSGAGGAGGCGGGIYSFVTRVSLTGVILSGNTTGHGGNGGSMGGSAGSGGDGGGYCEEGANTTTISGSVITLNPTGGAGTPGSGGAAAGAGVGGGIAEDGNTGSQMTVTGSTISGNSGNRGGGGVYNIANLTLANDTISGNTASGVSGGGGILNGGPLTLRNSTVVGNHADATSFGGGGVRHASGTISFVNNLLTQNSANVGGVDYHRSGGGYFDYGFNFITNFVGNGESTALSDIIGNTTPKLGSPADNGGVATLPDGAHPQTVALLPGSPAIDTGSNTYCANPDVGNVDERGVNRPKGSACDIGAFEFVPAATLTRTSYPVGTAGGRVTLTGTNLESVTKVTLDGVAVTGAVSSGGGARLSVPIPAHMAGTMVAVVVTNTDAGTTGVNGTLLYVAPNAAPATEPPGTPVASTPAPQPTPAHPLGATPPAATIAAQPGRH